MGLIHLDAGVVIGFLDANDAHHAASRAVLAEAISEGHVLAMTMSAYAECLVGPARRGDDAVRLVRDLVERLPISLAPLDEDTALHAASLRAAHRSLRLPDALVVAAAERAGADVLVTTDRRWPTAKALRVKVEIRRL